ncbi:hypothetical protein PybrP1_013052 [[Pythium] brassicae (nom. inval.)]|nr:hypothetical protein PybrP1_013052 [[Pythium] brassicae (nom. inval.)]
MRESAELSLQRAAIYYNFHFDRKVFRATLALSPPGSFERHARMSADPAQVTLFLINFNSLRIQSVLGFLIRIGMNLTFAYRLKRIIEVMAQRAEPKRSVCVVPPSPAVEPPLAVQKAVSKRVALLFLGLGCALLAYTHQCISTSQASCLRYPSCAAHAHRAVGGRDLCPCIAMIDVEKAPKTYAEWTNPLDATGTLAELAKSGDVRVIELTNRRLTELPGELHESLQYTGIQVIPDWVKDFEHLEFLNVEGKVGDVNLVSMPTDLFVKTTSLTFLHLRAHLSLSSLPSFKHATNLKSISIVMMPALQELPSLASLRHLERLELLNTPRVQDILGLGALPQLLHLVVVNLGASCNGALGYYDASWPLCVDVDCSAPARAADDATLGVEQVDMCGGVLYRRCSVSGVDTGVEICLNDRMRIQRCLGAPCDPEVEAWLGATPTLKLEIDVFFVASTAMAVEDCPAAAKELDAQVVAAKADLRAKGLEL